MAAAGGGPELGQLWLLGKEDGWFPSPKKRADSLQGMARANVVVSKYVKPKYTKEKQTCIRKHMQTSSPLSPLVGKNAPKESVSMGSQTQQIPANFRWGKKVSETHVTLAHP